MTMLFLAIFLITNLLQIKKKVFEIVHGQQQRSYVVVEKSVIMVSSFDSIHVLRTSPETTRVDKGHVGSCSY